MKCPVCHRRMKCIDSRDTTSKVYGELRRRRWSCDDHGRHTSVEMLLRDGVKCDTGIREKVDVDFKRDIRTAANYLLRVADGK